MIVITINIVIELIEPTIVKPCLVLIHSIMILIRAASLSHSVHRQWPDPSQLLSLPETPGLRCSKLFLKQKITRSRTSLRLSQ